MLVDFVDRWYSRKLDWLNQYTCKLWHAIKSSKITPGTLIYVIYFIFCKLIYQSLSWCHGNLGQTSKWIKSIDFWANPAFDTKLCAIIFSIRKPYVPIRASASFDEEIWVCFVRKHRELHLKSFINICRLWKLFKC